MPPICPIYAENTRKQAIFEWYWVIFSHIRLVYDAIRLPLTGGWRCCLFSFVFQYILFLTSHFYLENILYFSEFILRQAHLFYIWSARWKQRWRRSGSGLGTRLFTYESSGKVVVNSCWGRCWWAAPRWKLSCDDKSKNARWNHLYMRFLVDNRWKTTIIHVVYMRIAVKIGGLRCIRLDDLCHRRWH